MKTDKAIWKPPLSKRTPPPFQLTFYFWANFSWAPSLSKFQKQETPLLLGGREGGGRKLCYIYSKFVITKWMILLLVTETFYLLESGQVYSAATYAIFFPNRDYCHFCHFISIFIKQLFHLCKNWVKPKTWGLNHWISHSRKWP